MPTARELLEQADALMRRNRARVVDTEIPELTDVVPDAVPLPLPPTRLDEVPELTDIVEEIEIASIAELPEDRGVPSEWLHLDRDVVTLTGSAPAALAAVPATPQPWTADAGTGLPVEVGTMFIDAEPSDGPAETGAATVDEVTEAASAEATAGTAAATVAGSAEIPVIDISTATEVATAVGPAEAASVDVPAQSEASVVVLPADIATACAPDVITDLAEPAEVAIAETTAGTLDVAPLPEPVAPEATPATTGAVATDDWARWQALAEEIRMQVLQRVDIFTDTGLREQLGAQLQPIVDRASAEMVATVNEQVGTLLRAYIAEAIEREIEKWREGNR